MPPVYTVRAQVIDIRSDKPQPSDALLWIPTFGFGAPIRRPVIGPTDTRWAIIRPT